MNLPRFFICGERPVKFERTDNDEVDILVYDWDTKKFIFDISYLEKVYTSDEVEEVTEEEFNKYLEKLRNEKQ